MKKIATIVQSCCHLALQNFFFVEDLQRVTTSSSLMEDRKEFLPNQTEAEKNAPWLSVPQFGDWDQKGQVPDYSLDFSKIREMRKQNKRDVSRASLGNEEELISSNSTTANSTVHSDHHPDYHENQHSPSVRILYLCFGSALNFILFFIYLFILIILYAFRAMKLQS
ncbi:hypothetical protein FEM48_Zijuj08G0174600 [Ziziphus jujuba var. spinosa]|uniref:RIN4 pathogenic type III effector avirulence factor Avr cleavage site domain-containing protein n=1 Tax=Ziziphus jujuba var. spinosa TaxID=714518 RepID=A0A978V0E7_ZIZJJ|nr:hypothetical protein FEM48_Zijuj08G0174600 [Ziziphus jujuba var. spinosa]